MLQEEKRKINSGLLGFGSELKQLCHGRQLDVDQSRSLSFGDLSLICRLNLFVHIQVLENLG